MCNSQTRSYNHKPENKTYNSVVCICFFLTFKLQLVLFVCAHFPNWFGRPFCFRGLMPLFPSQHLFFKCRAPPVKRSLPKLNCMHCDGTNTSFCQVSKLKKHTHTTNSLRAVSQYSRHSVNGLSVTGNIQLMDFQLSGNRMVKIGPQMSSNHSVTGLLVR